MKRSTRNVVLSKAMKHVDEETRREFREKRLQSLECDNYVETESAPVDDEAYNESDDDKGGPKKKRAKGQKNGLGAKSKWATKVVKPLERILLDNGIVIEHKRHTASAVTANAADEMDVSDDESVRQIVTSSSSSNLKSAGKQITAGALSRNTSSGNIKASGSANNHIGSAPQQEVNYHTIAAKPSVFPARQCFCSVCGYLGSYSCTRCGSKFCSIKCNESHKETRCFKFSM